MDYTPVVRFALMLVRPGFMMMTSPLFGGTFAPARVKVGLTVLLAMMMFPMAQVPAVGEPLEIVGVVAREAAIGFALALSIRVMTAGAELAGNLIGFQLGMSYGSVVDPQSGVRNNLLSVIYGNLAVVTLFVTNGHHAFLRALRDSYTLLPIGSGGIAESLPSTIVLMLTLLFSLGLRLAMPLIAVMVVVEVAMALLARSAPQLNLNAAGASVRCLIGLALLAIVVPQSTGVMASTTDTFLRLAAQATQMFR